MFPRPANDNGLGIHGPTGQLFGDDLNWWLDRLVYMGLKHVTTLQTDLGFMLAAARRGLQVYCRPFYRANKEWGDDGSCVENMIMAGLPPLIQIYNEPDLIGTEWENEVPGDYDWAMRTWADRWLAAAQYVYARGGWPGIQTLDVTWYEHLLNRIKNELPVILDRLWRADHNYTSNHHPGYPYIYGPLVQRNMLISNIERDPSALTGYEKRMQEIMVKSKRTEYVDIKGMVRGNIVAGSLEVDPSKGKVTFEHPGFGLISNTTSTGLTIEDDWFCILSPLKFWNIDLRVLGRRLPAIANEGGYCVGDAADNRFPTIDEALHAKYTIEMFNMFRTGVLTNGEPLPDEWIAVTPWLLAAVRTNNDSAFEQNAWYGAWHADRQATIDGTKAMSNFIRPLQGQNQPPVEEEPPMPEFHFGFKDLHDKFPEMIGEAVSEQLDLKIENGTVIYAVQATTKGKLEYFSGSGVRFFRQDLP